MDRVLGIDYGTSRVGLALSDALKITAQSLPTLEIRGNIEILISKVKELMSQNNIETVVIGYPKHLNGDISETAKIIDDVIIRLENLGLRVIKWDERLTTVMAHRTMKELGIKQKYKKIHADRLAAMYILEDYLRTLN